MSIVFGGDAIKGRKISVLETDGALPFLSIAFGGDAKGLRISMLEAESSTVMIQRISTLEADQVLDRDNLESINA